MSKIMDYLLKKQEEKPLKGQFEDYLAPEVELPKDYQTAIDKEEWWKDQDETFKDDEQPVF